MSHSESLAKPLKGSRILVTRASDQAAEISQKLSMLGAQVIEIPLISIDPPDSWEPLDKALQNISSYDWILFASANAVNSCLKRLALLCLDNSELNKTKIAAIGPSTKEVLTEHQLSCDFSPHKFIGEGLVAEFPGYPNLSGIRILWPRTNIGRDYVIDELSKAGATVEAVTCYKTSSPENPEQTAQQLNELFTKQAVDVVTLMSAQTARNLGTVLKDSLSTDFGKLLSGVLVASIGPETSKAARQHLGKVDIEANQYTVDGLIEAITEFLEA